jgi:1-acyl-sn-glycerol-3-phosphate acyltransferase
VKLRWRVAWLALYPGVKLALKLRVTGRDNIGPGPQIIASNHVSNVDPIIVGLAAKHEVHFLAKEELFLGPKAFAWLIRTFNAWPVRRGAVDPGAIRHCSWLLQRHQNVVLFPEGTRSKTGAVCRFLPGIGMLAVANRAPVVPAYLGGVSRSMISYLADRDFVRRGFRKKPDRNLGVHVCFGAPVYPDAYAKGRQGYAELAREVEDRVRTMARASGDLPAEKEGECPR